MSYRVTLSLPECDGKDEADAVRDFIRQATADPYLWEYGVAPNEAGVAPDLGGAVVVLVDAENLRP